MISNMEYDLGVDESAHGLSILKRFSCSREKELRCDLTIKVGEKELKVNREFMIVASDYIAAMFAHDTLEKQTGIVNMRDAEFEIVKKCVDYIYTGKISISFEKCEDLLYVACLMQLWTLREYIGLFLKKHLTVSSFFHIRQMAVKFSIENLANFCNEFAFENIDLLTDEEEFAQLDANSFLSVINAKKATSIGGGDIKVLSILKWIKFDPQNRQEHLVRMLESVDLRYVSKSYSRNLVENEPLCYQSADCTRMFYLATMDGLGVKRQKMDSETNQNPNAIAIFDAESNALLVFKPSGGTWLKTHNLHGDMVGNTYTAVSVRRYLFVLMSNKKVFRLNIAENKSKWIRMRDMLQEHGTSITATVLEDFIYIAGKNSIERYSLRQDSWKMIDSGRISLNSCVLVSHGDSIYSIGSGAHSYVLKEANKNMESPCWNSIAPLQVEGEIYSAVSHDGLVYASNQGSVDHFYCPETNTWTGFDSGHNWFRSLQVAGGVLFSVRSDPFGSPSTLYRYNLPSKNWIHVTDMPSGKPANRPILSVLLPEWASRLNISLLRPNTL